MRSVYEWISHRGRDLGNWNDRANRGKSDRRVDASVVYRTFDRIARRMYVLPDTQK